MAQGRSNVPEDALVTCREICIVSQLTCFGQEAYYESQEVAPLACLLAQSDLCQQVSGS